MIYHHGAPLSLVPASEYPKYLAPSDDDLPAEDHPLPTNSSPTDLSPGYITDFEPIKDGLEEDPEMDPVDYPSNKEESSKEEEPLAPADSASPAWTRFMDHIRESRAEIRVLQAKTRVLQQQRRDDYDLWIGAIGRIHELERARDLECNLMCVVFLVILKKMTSTRTSMSQEALEELISPRITDVLSTLSKVHSTTSRMVSDESHKVEKYTGGLSDNIQGSVMAFKLKTLQEAKLTRSLMDQKLLTYAARQAENKRKMDNNSKNNQAQQPSYKR
uniref:Reverse transcriptase domain-containing protein n=1 Tax=Tanacetum cinerariifolium TaxID=118510 RepID=A0A6L2JMT5_TANCI|nr:hypothetical protein [Tanacetum cinerariifolium]